MAAATDMEGVQTANSQPDPAKTAPTTFSVNILQIIKSSQTQYGGHGGTYGDYTRYRRYCFSRLRRLYKSLKFLHGRGKYVKKSLEPSMITDARFLHIPLFSAERAWSYFMELKQAEHKLLQQQRQGKSSLRSHLLRRLTKACKWADMLASLCVEKADSRTALEAEAYSSYLWGTYFVERETDWNTALNKFLRARAVYEHLSKVGDLNHQVMCRQRVEELDTNIRFCNYKSGKGGLDQTGLTDISTDENPALELLQSKLEVMMEEERSQQASSLMELNWCGHHLPVHDAKTRMCILKGQELENDLVKLSTSSPEIPISSSSFISTRTISNSDRRLSLFDKIFLTYQEAKKRIRENMDKVGSAEDMKMELSLLERAVSSLLLQKFMERNALLVELAKMRWVKQQQGEKGEKVEKGEKSVRLEEIVRLYDILIQNISELIDLVLGSKECNESEKKFGKWLEAERIKYQAFRCFFIAHSFLKNSKLHESYALFNSAAKKANEAKSIIEEAQLDKFVASETKNFQSNLDELFSLEKESKTQRRILHVNLISKDSKAKDQVQTLISKVSLSETVPLKNSVFDTNNLDVFVEPPHDPASGNTSKPFLHLVSIPPSFQFMPCRPIVLDTALDFIDFPALDARVKQEVKKTGIFNFWRR